MLHKKKNESVKRFKTYKKGKKWAIASKVAAISGIGLMVGGDVAPLAAFAYEKIDQLDEAKFATRDKARQAVKEANDIIDSNLNELNEKADAFAKELQEKHPNVNVKRKDIEIIEKEYLAQWPFKPSDANRDISYIASTLIDDANINFSMEDNYMKNNFGPISDKADKKEKEYAQYKVDKAKYEEYLKNMDVSGDLLDPQNINQGLDLNEESAPDWKLEVLTPDMTAKKPGGPVYAFKSKNVQDILFNSGKNKVVGDVFRATYDNMSKSTYTDNAGVTHTIKKIIVTGSNFSQPNGGNATYGLRLSDMVTDGFWTYYAGEGLDLRYQLFDENDQPLKFDPNTAWLPFTSLNTNPGVSRERVQVKSGATPFGIVGSNTSVHEDGLYGDKASNDGDYDPGLVRLDSSDFTINLGIKYESARPGDGTPWFKISTDLPATAAPKDPDPVEPLDIYIPHYVSEHIPEIPDFDQDFGFEDSETSINSSQTIDGQDDTSTPEKALALKDTKDDFYTKANFKAYIGPLDKIEATLTLPSEQTINKDDFIITDPVDNTVNVADKGEITTKKNDDGTTSVIWKANADFVKDVNARYEVYGSGANIAFGIKTDMSSAKYDDLVKYKQLDGTVLLPATAKLILGHNGKDQTAETGKTYVQTKMPLDQPGEPTFTKEVSTDDGATWQATDKDNPAVIPNAKDEYQWKLSFTPEKNTREINNLTLSDSWDKAQVLSQDKIHVYDVDGQDITDKGSVSIEDAGDRSNVSWKANEDFLKDYNDSLLNKKDSDHQIKMVIATSIDEGFVNDHKDRLENSEILIENKGNSSVENASGKVDKESNSAWAKVVMLQKPTIAVEKTVSTDDGKTWSRGESKVEDLDKPILWKVDGTFTGQQLNKISFHDNINQSLGFTKDDVHVYDWDGKDVTDKGEISLGGNDLTWNATDKDFLASADKFEGDGFKMSMQVSTKLNVEDVYKAQENGGNFSVDNIAQITVGNAVGEEIAQNPESNIPVISAKAPSLPALNEVKSTVSVDGGLSYAETGTITDLDPMWKIEAKVTGEKLNNIKISNTISPLVDVDIKDVHVYDWDGKDITDKAEVALVADHQLEVNINDKDLLADLAKRDDATGNISVVVKTPLTKDAKNSADQDGNLTVENSANIVSTGAFDKTASADSNTATATKKFEIEKPEEKPEAAKIEKSVSVDGGKSFSTSTTGQEHLKLSDFNDSILWKIKTEFAQGDLTSLMITDQFAAGQQELDLNKIHVYNWDGTDVTTQGTFGKLDSGTDINLSWKPNKELLDKINAQSAHKPGYKIDLTMTIETNLLEQKDKPVAGQKTLVANSAEMQIGTKAGKTTSGSNVSYVEWIAPEITEEKPETEKPVDPNKPVDPEKPVNPEEKPEVDKGEDKKPETKPEDKKPESKPEAPAAKLPDKNNTEPAKPILPKTAASRIKPLGSDKPNETMVNAGAMIALAGIASAGLARYTSSRKERKGQ